MNIPFPLLTDISKGKASLFLGAGASQEAGFPSSEDIAKYLASRAGNPHTEVLNRQPLDFVAQYLYLQSGYGKRWVREEIIAYFEKKHRQIKHQPSCAHETMTKVRWRTMFTTNYDRLVEIAYELSRDSVQRILPIYAPDLQIKRHEPEVLRLIKLDGSVDEAQRNIAHELVLTFAEQQEARSRNKELYNLLRQEAIDGPIIFVGFRFMHPGASMPGTSPEFLLLKELLREIGSLARWHYLVSPFDSTSPTSRLTLDVLQGIQVDVINGTFGEFLSNLIPQLTPTIPLSKRQPIIIPCANTSIQLDADEYDKDKRHFEVLGPHLEGLEPRNVTQSLNGEETWASFFSGHFIKRTCQSDFREVINNCICNPPNILFLGAPPGWGKTFLLRALSVEFYREQKPVIWLNPYGTIEVEIGGQVPVIVGKWDTTRIDRILGMIDDKVKEESLAERVTPIIIADNCPERVEEVLSLFRDLASNNRSFVLIFTARDNEFDILVKKHKRLKRARSFRPEGLCDSTKEEIPRLIDFCAEHNVAKMEDAWQKEIITKRVTEDIGDKTDIALILALQVIFDRQHRPFSQIVKSFWQNLEDEICQQLVLRVSILHRFGSIFSPRIYSLLQTFPSQKHSQVLKAYRDCLDKKILFERAEDLEYCAYTLHSLVADRICKCSEKTPVELDDELIGLVRHMGSTVRDLEIVRRLLKRINDYEINLSSENKTKELFQAAIESTNADWVACHQFSQFLLQRSDYEMATVWVERAIKGNETNTSLKHSKGNILRRWGIALELENEREEARKKFDEARKYFAISRVGPDPNEYGYVTHLDMLLHLINNEQSEPQKTNLIIEGVQLYRKGIQDVREDRFNLLLEERFQKGFDLNKDATIELCDKIQSAVSSNRASARAAVFLAEQLYLWGNYNQAVDILLQQRSVSDKGILTWIKEAEFHAREGDFSQAVKCIDSAKRRRMDAEDLEALWSLLYWSLLIAIVTGNLKEAKISASELEHSGFFSRHNFPRGYIWKQTAKNIKPRDRSFREHAAIWSGRVENVQASGGYGVIILTDIAGESFYISFNRRYFLRRDFKRGDTVQFVIAFLPNRLRADAIDTTPFVNTIDDLFVP